MFVPSFKINYFDRKTLFYRWGVGFGPGVTPEMPSHTANKIIGDKTFIFK